MKLTIQKSEWLKPIQQLSNIAPIRNTLPILSSILIDTKDKITLSATDLEIGMNINVSAEVALPANITIPAKKFLDILNSIDSDEITIETLSNDRIKLSAGNSKFTLTTLPIDEFPPIASIQSDNYLALDYDLFAKMIKSVIMCVSTEETRHFLNGVYFQVIDKTINVAGTDGKRLAHVKTETEWDGKISAIIPIKTINALLKMSAKELLISMNENQMCFQDKDLGVTVVSRLIEGEYPDYKAVINPVLLNPNKLTLKTADLVSSLRRVAVMSNAKVRSTKFAVDIDGFDGKLSMVSQSAEVGEATDWMGIEGYEIPNKEDGSETKVEFALNADYLLSMLGAISTEMITLRHRDALSPILVQESDNTNTTHILMPMRL
jgi:DNA polymerase-3 subunit beta